jgi:hypothetical protein
MMVTRFTPDDHIDATPDIIVTVDAACALSIRLYAITERGLEFEELDSGDPPFVHGRSKYGWAVDPDRIEAAVRRAEDAGLFVVVSQRPAFTASQAMREWRDAEAAS